LEPNEKKESMEAHDLEIRLFGPLEVRLRGEPLSSLPSRKGLWLLGLLALRQGREVARDWLAETLWPESEANKALFNLRQSLAGLRRALGDAAERVQSPTPQTLCLDRESVWSDVAAFDAAIAQEDRDSQEEAIALYRGPLLEDCGEEWATLERTAREQAYLRVLEALAGHATACGDPASAVRWLRLALAAEPLREASLRALMQALADGGEYAAVTQTYRDFRLLLRRELNADPSPETETLYQRLHAQSRQPTSSTLPPRDPALPLRRLPVPLTQLVGREEAIETVRGWLGKERLVTLTGMGGIGKTRLSLAVGAESLGAFPDGVWFVELAALSDPQHLPQAVAKTLGLREEVDYTLAETLTDFVSARSLLLILDNCEHLLDACATLASALLSSAPGSRVLATSRQPLGVTGERVYRVASLVLPPDEETLCEKEVTAALDYPAVRLFAERALAAHPAFRLTRQNVQTVIQICRRLDGIPLALELAASRLRSLSVEELNERLDDRFGLLTSGNRAALPRHQTLRALVDWSYDLLEESERTVLRRLSVFAEGWTHGMAEAVCQGVGKNPTPEHRNTQIPNPTPNTKNQKPKTKNQNPTPDPVFDVLDSLVDKSLVFCEEQAGVTRYHFLETVHQYAQDRLIESGDAEETRKRHALYFLSLAEGAEQKLYEAEQAQWLDLLEQEHDNLRSALAWCLGEKEEGERRKEESMVLPGVSETGLGLPPSSFLPHPSEIGLRLAGALGRFWGGRGYIQEGQEWLARALAQGDKKPTLYRAKTLLQAGWMAHFKKEFEAVHAFHDEALAIYRAEDDRKGVLHCRYLRAGLARIEGNLPEARRLYEECLVLSRDTGDQYGPTLMHLGLIFEAQGDFAEARRLFEEALHQCRQEGSLSNVVICLANLGLYLCQEGAYTEARASLAEGLTLSHRIGARQTFVQTLERLAVLAAALQQGTRAVRLWGAAAALRNAFSLIPNSDPTAQDIVREALGESNFQAAWEEGSALTQEQAVAYALQEPPS
jgi:predicted ATPase/DNA-binding SARP family transcriptional activator/Tfp pilus assembly protein PilF